MNPSMINAATSMSGLQRKIDTVANNVANVNTVGYKRQDASFYDVLTSVKAQGDELGLDGRKTPLGLTMDWGSSLSRVQLDLAQGSLQQTDHPLDVALEGNALFEISQPRLNNDGQPLVGADGNPVLDRLWTRNGSFQLIETPGNAENLALATKDGRLVRGMNDEPLLVPRQHRIEIDSNGNIWAYPDSRPAGLTEEREDQEQEPIEDGEAANAGGPVFVGQLKIVQVNRPQMLEGIGGGWFQVIGNEQAADGALEVVDLNVRNEQTESIAVHQGFLEQSNVDLSQEMTELITLQRSLQFNSRVLASADQMADLTNKLRG